MGNLIFNQKVKQDLSSNEGWTNQEFIIRAFNKFLLTGEIAYDKPELDNLIGLIQKVFDVRFLHLCGISHVTTDDADHYIFFYNHGLKEELIEDIITRFDDIFQPDDDDLLMKHSSDQMGTYFQIIIAKY